MSIKEPVEISDLLVILLRAVRATNKALTLDEVKKVIEDHLCVDMNYLQLTMCLCEIYIEFTDEPRFRTSGNETTKAEKLRFLLESPLHKPIHQDNGSDILTPAMKMGNFAGYIMSLLRHSNVIWCRDVIYPL